MWNIETFTNYRWKILSLRCWTIPRTSACTWSVILSPWQTCKFLQEMLHNVLLAAFCWTSLFTKNVQIMEILKLTWCRRQTVFCLLWPALDKKKSLFNIVQTFDCRNLCKCIPTSFYTVACPFIWGTRTSLPDVFHYKHPFTSMCVALSESLKCFPNKCCFVWLWRTVRLTLSREALLVGLIFCI